MPGIFLSNLFLKNSFNPRIIWKKFPTVFVHKSTWDSIIHRKTLLSHLKNWWKGNRIVFEQAGSNETLATTADLCTQEPQYSTIEHAKGRLLGVGRF